MKQWSKRWGRHIVTIGPGGVYVAEPGELIGTLLGSCVSVCLRDTEAGVGGMNHVMVPLERPDAQGNARLIATAYGAYAMEVLLNQVFAAGGRRERFEVKIFGGGRMLSGVTDIGLRNIEFVRTYLHTEKVRLIAEDVGGTAPRKLLFDPKTGRVKVRKMRGRVERVAARETDAIEARQNKVADVELF